jgi:hypothetical protein
MSIERRDALFIETCQVLGIPCSEQTINAGMMEVGGFDARLDFYDDDPAALYLNFEYGIVTSGRTLRIFRLLLEANFSIYAQDQAQLGLDAERESIVLLLRIPFYNDLDGAYIASLIEHYIEHGLYWRENILQASDEMFDNLASGAYFWIRA